MGSIIESHHQRHTCYRYWWSSDMLTGPTIWAGTRVAARGSAPLSRGAVSRRTAETRVLPPEAQQCHSGPLLNKNNRLIDARLN
jgi:hypothetical protein